MEVHGRPGVWDVQTGRKRAEVKRPGVNSYDCLGKERENGGEGNDKTSRTIEESKERNHGARTHPELFSLRTVKLRGLPFAVPTRPATLRSPPH